MTSSLPQDINHPPPAQGEDLSVLSHSFTFRTYSYRETLLGEFERLSQDGRGFDGLIIDLTQTGFSLPLDTLLKFYAYGKRLLKPQGVLLLIKADGALTLTKDDPGGGLTLNVYDSSAGIFARYPLLADYVCATIPGIDRRRLHGGNNTLANHILFTSTPVLTPRGQALKNSFELPPPQNWLLQTIDDYASTESICRLLQTQHSMQNDEILRLLQELEAEGAIYPIFSRIHFLADCYHNHKPFRLGRYMVAAGIIAPSQLEELLELQQEQGWGNNSRTFLGLLAVRKGYVNTREVEILLHDQFIYGGYHKVTGDFIDTASASQKKRSLETMRDAMIGSLSAIDCAGLLNSISQAKKTGLLTIENRDQAIVVAFTEGQPTHARLNKLTGASAIVELLVSWQEGIFVFRDKGCADDLDDSCAVTASLNRLLLDAALFQDQINQFLSRLPGRRNAILERVWNFEPLWRNLPDASMKYFDGTAVTDSDQQYMADIAKLIDGLTTLDEVIAQSDSWTSQMTLKAVQFLLDNKLIVIQQTSLFRPLTVFQRIIGELQEHIGKADSKAILESSLHYVHGDSPTAQRFDIDFEGRVSVNLNQVKTSGTPVSAVLLELRRWMEAYLAYARRQCDPQLVDNVVAKVVNSTMQ